MWQRTGRNKEKLNSSVKTLSPRPARAAEGASGGTKPPPGGGVRFVNDFPGLQLSVTLGEAGFIYAAHAVGYEKDKRQQKKPHHAICIRSPCLGRLKREVLSL